MQCLFTHTGICIVIKHNNIYIPIMHGLVQGIIYQVIYLSYQALITFLQVIR